MLLEYAVLHVFFCLNLDSAFDCSFIASDFFSRMLVSGECALTDTAFFIIEV